MYPFNQTENKICSGRKSSFFYNRSIKTLQLYM